MNILVTGSTGFIGKNLVNYLLKKNHNLCLVSKKKKLKFIKKKKDKRYFIAMRYKFK